MLRWTGSNKRDKDPLRWRWDRGSEHSSQSIRVSPANLPDGANEMDSRESFQILLAEDNEAEASLVREALRRQQIPCELIVKIDGARAIQFRVELDAGLTKRRLDLVLPDFHLPIREGPEVLVRLRSADRFAQTPVILLTSSSRRLDPLARPDERVRYFHKPMSLSGCGNLAPMMNDILLQTEPTQ